MAFPTFSANGSNAAKNVKVTFTRAGTYRFQATITNLAGLSTTSSVTVTVNQTTSIVVVTPVPAGLTPGESQQYSASAQDQFGVTLSVQPSFAWSIASGTGMVTSTGLYTAPGGSTGTLALVTATTVPGGASGSALAYVLSSDWSTQDIGAVAIGGAAGDNGSGTFGLAGSGSGLLGTDSDSFRFAYQPLTGDGVIVAQISSQQSQSTTALAGVMIRGDLTAGAPMAAMGVTVGGALDFVDRVTASTVTTSTSGGTSQFPTWVRLVRTGNTFTGYSSSDGVTWTEWGSANIAMGTTVYVGLAITSASSVVLDTAILDQVSIDTTPTVAAPASAPGGAVAGTTTNLAVLGDDDLGESTLTYTWAATAVPAGASSPTFAINATNAAKNDTVTFTQAGNYTFTVTIANPGGLTITSSVNVVVNQTVSNIIVAPPTAALSAAGTQPFSALAYDQFGQVLVSPPAFTWSVAVGGIGGTIDAAGRYTRPSPGIGNDTVVASLGAQSGTAVVTVTPGAATQLVVTTQPPSSVTAGGPFGLVVSGEDEFGNVDPSFGGSVSLPAAFNPAILGGPLTVTASLGVAVFSGLVLDQANPAVTLLAVSGVNLGPATTARFAVTAAAATQLAILTPPADSVVAGNDFGLDVAVEDLFGNVVASYAGSVMLALADGPGGATLGGTVMVNVDQGVASFVDLTLDRTSPGVTIQATSDGLSAVTTSAIAVVPAAAAQLEITSQPPSSVTAGDGFALQVEALDDFGNVATAFSGSVALDLADNRGDGTLTGTFTAPAVLGVATFANVILDQAGTGYTLRASSAGVDSATTDPLTVVAGMATQLVTTPPPSGSVAAGSGFGVTVSAEDSYGNLADFFSGSVTLTLVDSPMGATLGGSTTVTASGGVATFSNLSLDTAGTGYTLQASSSGVTSAVTGSFTVDPAGAVRLVIIRQPPATVTAGSGFAVSVQGEDAFGNFVGSFSGTVILSLANNPGGPGAMPGGPLAAMAVSGVATFSNVVLDVADANYTLQASSGNLTPATTSPITVGAATATHLAIIAAPGSSVTAGSPFGLVLAGEDPYGNVDQSFAGSVTVALAGNPAGDSLGGTFQASANSGIASFADLTLTRAANGVTLRASSSLPGSVTTSPFLDVAGAATTLVVTTAPSSIVTAGSGFGLSVTAEDLYGNPATSFAGDVTLALGSNPAGDALGGSTTVSVSAGVAAFAGLTLDKVASGDTLVASSGIGSVTTMPIAVAAAAATQLVVTSQPPPSLVAGDIFGLTVTAEDPFGNTDLTYTGMVALGLSAGPAGATLGGTSTGAAVQGVASLSGLTLDQAGDNYTLQVSSGLGVATTNALTVSPAAAAQLVVTIGPPPSVVAGHTFGLVVTAEDRFANPVPTYAVPVTVSLVGTSAEGSLGGTLSATPSGGMVAFSDLTLNKVSGGVVVFVSSGSLPVATTAPIAVTAGAAMQLVVTSQPAASVTAGARFGLGVTAEDAFGNIASDYSDDVTVALKPGFGGGTLGGTLTVKPALGVATFGDLMLTTVAGGLQLQVTSASLGGATSDPFAIVAARATQLVVTTQPPPSAIAGNGFGLVVQAEDPFGNIDLSFTGAVTVALASGAQAGTLAGTLNLGAVAGVAAFSGLTLNTVGTAEILQTTSPGFAPVLMNPIVVNAGAVAQLSVTTQPPASVTAGKTFGLMVAAEDRFGNLNPAFVGDVTLTLSKNSAQDTLGGTLTMMVVAGMVQFSDLTLTKTAAGDTIAATTGDLAVVTAPFAVGAAAATQLAVTTQPPASVTAGNGFGLVVEAEDPYGNTDLSFSGPLMLTLANPSGGGALGGTLSVSADAGMAAFTGLSLKQAGSGYTLLASGNGLSGATTDPIAIAAAAATQLVVTGQPPPSVTAGRGFELVVVAEDEFGNVDGMFSASVALTSSDGEPLGGTPTMTAKAGVADFTGLTLISVVSGNTLHITSSGLVSADTGAFNVIAAPASQLVVTTPPPGVVTAGSEFGAAVSAEDPFGNVDPNFHGSVTLSLASDPGGSPLVGPREVTTNSGVAIFTGLTLNQAAAGYALAASSSSLTSTPPVAVAVGAAPASQLVVAAQPPSSVNAGAGFGLVALAEDRFGNVDPHFGGNVSLALASNPGDAALGGTIGATASGGVATFAGVTINQGGSGYSLLVTAGGLSGAVTGAFGVIPPPATVVSVALQNQKVGMHKTSTVIVVAFTEPLSAAAAANLGSYSLHTLPRGKAHKTSGVALARASYSPLTNTVTLVPRNKQALASPLQLQINSSTLTDALGRPLDGNHDGQPGGNFLATLKKGGVTITGAVRSGPAFRRRHV